MESNAEQNRQVFSSDEERVLHDKPAKIEYQSSISTVDLPIDCWSIILTYLADSGRVIDWYYLMLSTTSKHLNSICKKYKQSKHEISITQKALKGKELLAYFAQKGYLSYLAYARENGSNKWDKFICSQAAMYGQLEILKYAHENGWTWDVWTSRYAAERGRLECLKYIHENGCPWDDGTCSSAAENGYIECLKYAHENGCPWDFDTCSFASETGQDEIVKYAHENGCPCRHQD